MEKKTYTIAFAYPKGGVAKSQSTNALASYLSTISPTVVIDMDSQCSVSNSLLQEDLPEPSSYELLKKQASFNEVVVPTSDHYLETLFLVPGSPKLSRLDSETAANFDRQFLMADALKDTDDFKFRIIDCPSSVSINTVASLVAATHVIAPVLCEPNSWEQLGAFKDLYEQVKKRLNVHLRWIGILPTRFDGRNNLDREVLESLRSEYGAFVFSPIRSTVKLRETLIAGKPPWTQPNEDYQQFANELLERINYYGQKVAIEKNGVVKR